MDHELIQNLLSVQRRLRQQYFWRWLAVLAIVATGVSLVLRLGPWTISQRGVWWFGSAVILAAATIIALTARKYAAISEVAHRIERAFPELQQRLITAVAQLQQTRLGPRGYLETTVLQQTLRHGFHARWSSIVSPRNLALQRVVALSGLVTVSGILWELYQRPAALRETAAAADGRLAPDGKLEVVVDPGNREIERGSSLIISARFPRGVPREATLWMQRQGEEAERIPMARNLEDPLFAAYLSQVNQPATYRVEFAGQLSEEFQLTVFEYPEMLQADASLDYPEYTQLPDKVISDTRRVSAVEGSNLTWTTRLNKPVAEAWLEDKAGTRYDLQTDTDDPQAYHARFSLESDQEWTLHLRDAAGRSNQAPPELVARVLMNRPPELKPTVARDLSVSPLEELTVSASAWDDFGIVRYGIAYAVASARTRDEVLGQDVAAQQETDVAYELNFEALDAKPDQLLAYHFWAEDVGPDGQPRRSQSDIYFADVRHFEEIFREGQSPPGGAPMSGGQRGQNAQQADQLLEMQKQIISATWNLLRRESGKALTDQFNEDIQLLVESQQEAVQNLEQLGQRVESAESSPFVQEAREHMNRSSELLNDAAEQRSATRLSEAVGVQQSAYQALLQLRAREHEVVRGSSGGGAGGGGGSARQQQLQELELQNDQSRYETQQSATPLGEQEEAAREMRQILSRLRDLARRQQDINKQLRDLQTALQQAQTEEEREELERQLKRLRDQQEQLLRDTDDAQERMDQARNQRQLQEAREQLQESRERVQQSTEATAEGNVSEALAAGTRAERQFEETADQVRRQTANQFTEAVEQLRTAARQLESEQGQIGQEMRERAQPSAGLRPDDESSELQERLAQQRQRLEDLTNQMQQTIQDSETAEPLLAQKLYDAYRGAAQQQIDRSLQTSQQLLENGFRQEATEQEEQAREGIRQLRDGVEDAAGAVLGDEAEGLRRAAGTLSELIDQLNRELQRSSQGGQGQPPSGDPHDADARPGQDAGQQDEPQRRQGQGEPRQTAQNQDDATSAGRQPGESQQPSPSEGDGEGQADREGQTRPESQAGQAGQSGTSGQGEDSPQDEDAARSRQQQEGQAQGESEQGQQVGESQGQQTGQRSGQTGQPGGQQGEQSGQGGGQGQGEQSDAAQQPPRDGEGRGLRGGRDGGRSGGQQGTDRDGGGWWAPSGESLGTGPITGNGFEEWSDRLRDVEEMVNDAELRSRAAQIRDRARTLRRDMRRRTEAPQWDLVEELVATPLEELRQQVEQELARRSGEREQLVPVDRDPVPHRFEGRVRHYYEQLGQGE
jgi:hypothetical protein